MGSKRFSARDRQTQATTWTTISFVLESAVFLAMGYQLPELVDAARAETTVGEITGLVATVVALLVVLRFIGLLWPALASRFGRGDRNEQQRTKLTKFEEALDALNLESEREETRLAWARRRLARGRADVEFEEREPLTSRGMLVLAWAGMRGVVTVAAVQTIPADVPHAATVVLAAFLVALFTLVVFGLTLPWVIARLKFQSETAAEKRDATQSLLRRIGESAIDTMGPLEEQTVAGERLDPELVETMKERIIPRRYLDAMRDTLGSERSIGAYSSATYRQVEGIIDSIEQRFRPA